MEMGYVNQIIYIIEMVLLMSTALDVIPNISLEAESVCSHNCMTCDKLSLSQDRLHNWHQVKIE